MMSHRGKRQALSRLDDITPVATKRRKGRASTTAEEEETPTLEQRQSYSSADMKISSIYNRSVTDAPAELFRKDLISAMKLPDSEPLTSDHYWVITDQWKQEWERGVQVPVKPDSLPGPVVNLTNTTVPSSKKLHHEFKLPKNKYIRITKDEHFRVDEHYLSNVGIQAEKCCAYDLEDVDVVWLNIVNGERVLMGLPPISQDQLEQVIEELEMRCWEKVHAIVKKEEGLALEFDESVICDVCRSPDSEDGNEMVFCDCCNICVHQACYGITSIPAGSWLCRTCALGLRPECVLCPNKNGAMKSTRKGQKWAHVSCALWIPEVSIGCVEKMEPITKISSIPQSRWALICVLCRERVGACIQCSVKTCKTAYHVTCAFKHGLEMRAIIDEESTTDDDNTVKLRSYCQKHSISSKKEMSSTGVPGSDEDVKKKQRKDMTTEEKSHAKAVKVQEIEAEFEKHVTIKDITRKHDVDPEGLEYIYNYWVLKRRASFNKPLLAARSEDASDLLNKNQERVDQEKMRMFVQLRQDLERVRNLCYMVSRREKLSRTYQRLREQTFYKQAALLSDTRISLSTAEITAIKEANHGPSIYDRLYSHANAPDLSTDFETMVHRIAGRSDSELSPGLSFNGYVSGKNGKRSCFNGDLGKSSIYESLSSSMSDVDAKSRLEVDTESDTRVKVNNRMNKSQRKNNVENRTKNTARRRSNNSSSILCLESTTSTDGDDDVDDRKSTSSRLSQRPKKNSSKKQPSAVSHSLSCRSLSATADEDDSDDEFPFWSKKSKSESKKIISEIYSSDSDSLSSEKNSDDEGSLSSAKPIRTKASMKEFTASGSASRSSKERTGSNGINKSVSFSSSSKSTFNSTDKTRRVNKLFEDESDDTIGQNERKHKKEDRLSTSESDVFIPQPKITKTASDTTAVSRNKCKNVESHVKKERSKKPPAISEKKSSVRKDVFSEDSFSKDLTSSSEKNIANAANHDLLTLVPQREAAKKAIKAIEHIKNGMVKPATVFEDTENDISKAVKVSMKTKKENSSTTKQKVHDAEAKFDRLISVDKRPPQLKSSGQSSTVSASTANFTSGQLVINNSSVTSTPSLVTTTTTVSNTSASPFVSSSSATPAVTRKMSSTSGKKSSTSSSGSSSGSSSDGTSSSSSSSYSSSSSSSDSSSSGGSSSSSSESEPEDDAVRLPKKTLPNDKTVQEDIALSISCNASAVKPAVENKEFPSESVAEKKCIASVPMKEIEETNESKPSLPSLRLGENTSNEQKSRQTTPHSENRNDNYSADDQSSLIETKAAIEHLTNEEQNFMLPPGCWEQTTVSDKDDVKIATDLDSNNKHDTTSILSTLPNRSLFSPQLMKDIDLSANIDLSTFDNVEHDINENHNLNDNSGLSLASLAFTFGNDFAFKEDSKEDSARETLNLVEKLKLEMARKQTGNGENLDCITSAPTPNVVINHVPDEEEKEAGSEKMETDECKKDESILSENSSSQHTTNISSSDCSSALPSSELDKNCNESVLKSPSTMNDLYSSCPFQREILQSQADATMTEKENASGINENHIEAWPTVARQYEDAHPSPYSQDIRTSTDPRWSDSVMIPSRRSDSSSISSGSSSASSASFSEHQQQASHSEDVQQLNSSLPNLEMTSHMQKSVVADLFRPATSISNENPFAGTSMQDNMYSYEDHLSFVKNSFSSSPNMVDKSMYPQSVESMATAQTSSSIFSNPMHFDSVSGFAAGTNQFMNKAFGQPLSIQPPCAATASFTTTSQNMAIITSIISPVPQLSSDEAPVTTPVSAGSVNFEEKLADMISEPTQLPSETADRNPVETTIPNNDEGNSDNSFSQRNKDSYSEDKEKENMFINLVDSVIELSSSMSSTSSTSTNAIRPLAVKNEIEKKTDSVQKSNESVTVTTSPRDDVSVTTAKVQQPQLSTNSSKKSPVKPTRVSARVMSQNKSPAAKSPLATGVSPARVEPLIISKNKRDQAGSGSRKNHRANSKNASNRRGRGRGRTRTGFYRDWEGDTIHSKLVGTVYDFDDDDEFTGDNFENLRAMRERRKSTDTAYCDRLSTSSKDTSYSPKFVSPSSQSQPSKRKGSVAMTPDRRVSNRTQLSPLCEIGNNGRIMTKEMYQNQVPHDDDDDDDEEDEDLDEEDEDDEDEETVSVIDKKSNVISGSGGKSERSATSTSPTLPQPPVQSSAVDQFAAVQPLLPGPVDMRTYSGDTVYDAETNMSSFETQVTNTDTMLRSTFSATNSSSNEPMPDIVDALEKEIQQFSGQPATTGRNHKKMSPTVSSSPRVYVDVSSKSASRNEESYTSPNQYLGDHLDSLQAESTSVLLDDEPCRNQLKVKIKGPYFDANYAPPTASNATVAIPPLPSVASNVSNDVCFNVSAVNLNTAASSASSSNLRRMRKKELLRQYWTQDMNMDECGNDMATAVNQSSGISGEAPFGPASNTPVKSGPSYKLPKAVASMTTIPTKEDYRAVLDAANIEKKKRGKDKTSSSSSAFIMYDPADISNNNNIGHGFGNNNNNIMTHNNNKGSGRSPDKSIVIQSGPGTHDNNQESVPVHDNHTSKRKSRSNSSSVSHPKLKIKIGDETVPIVVNNSGGNGSSSAFEEQKNLRLRPPKKRICDQNDTPQVAANMEEVRRQCMQYRLKIRSQFSENGSKCDVDNDDSGKEDSSKKKRKRMSTMNSSRSGKRKKKQQRSREDIDHMPAKEEVVRVITKEVGGEGAPKKLIIKFGGLNLPTSSTATSSAAACSSPPRPPPSTAFTKPPKSSKRNLNHELDSVRTTKITPIRLKLSRSQKGYVSQPSCVDEEPRSGDRANVAAEGNLGSANVLPKENAVSSLSPSSSSVETTVPHHMKQMPTVTASVSTSAS